MQAEHERARTEAIHWRIRLRDADPRTWEEFADWLTRSPENSRAYDEVALADDSLDALPSGESSIRATNDNIPSWKRRSAIAGLAAAAAIAAAVIISPSIFGDTQEAGQIVSTRPGEQKSVKLADGSVIALNGSSAVELDGDNTRQAKLLRGEALFTVAHDPRQPFRVHAANYTVTDLGTEFLVENTGSGVRLEVAEGRVAMRGAGRSLVLNSGEVAKADAASLVTSRKDPALIGTWSDGYLSYADAPVAEVARDLSRAIGEEVSVAPGQRELRFTGVIQLQRDRRQLFGGLGAILGVPVQRTAHGWAIGSDSGGRASQA